MEQSYVFFGDLAILEVVGQKIEFLVLQSYGLLGALKAVLALVDHCGIFISQRFLLCVKKCVLELLGKKSDFRGMLRNQDFYRGYCIVNF